MYEIKKLYINPEDSWQGTSFFWNSHIICEANDMD